MSKRTAVITGIAGQDGSYLAELLLGMDYRVVGVRRPGSSNLERVAHLVDRIELVETDLLDRKAVAELLEPVAPDEVYNLAGHSFVPSSWDQPAMQSSVTALGADRLLAGIEAVDRRIRFYQASSSELFGNAASYPQTESTPLNPRNPYGEAKAIAYAATVAAREQRGLFVVSGFLFNHESPRRGLEFVTRKVTDGAARIALGLESSLAMGSLDAKRDWGYAGDYVRAMWLMLQQDTPADYVIASGVLHSVEDLCRIAFSAVDLDFADYVRVDPELVRPPEPFLLVGDASKAANELGWTPSVNFEQLVRMMVEADLERHRAQMP